MILYHTKCDLHEECNVSLALKNPITIICYIHKLKKKSQTIISVDAEKAV